MGNAKEIGRGGRQPARGRRRGEAGEAGEEVEEGEEGADGGTGWAMKKEFVTRSPLQHGGPGGYVSFVCPPWVRVTKPTVKQNCSCPEDRGKSNDVPRRRLKQRIQGQLREEARTGWQGMAMFRSKATLTFMLQYFYSSITE
ncbi:hypothetical protein L211DRAFT_604104 [Terfezia boudieri ATCC MYA-4762]|uniref:Uncharacterized protein n=1 Tax=Terfezia boudieri ATCC MYA-4762 TaxID=1051890 RepID=A0A3N4MC97_9PEZI|nr:hypothetical protein L211DRAFT_604104 [Terfezia boudieri ATCC MYA-4762]